MKQGEIQQAGACAQHQEARGAPPIRERRRYRGEVKESDTGDAAGEGQQEGDSAPHHDRQSESRSGDDSDGQAQEVVADGNEVRQLMQVEPGGQNCTQQRQQKSRDEEAGEGAPATGHTSLLAAVCEVH